jgi:hypothetical protein
MEYIHHELGKKFIFELKANRLVALSEEARKKGQYQNLNTLGLKDGKARKLWVKDLSLPVSLIKKSLQKRKQFFRDSIPCHQ